MTTNRPPHLPGLPGVVFGALVGLLVLVVLASVAVVASVRAYTEVRDFGPPPPSEVTVYYCDRGDCDLADPRGTR